MITGYVAECFSGLSFRCGNCRQLANIGQKNIEMISIPFKKMAAVNVLQKPIYFDSKMQFVGSLALAQHRALNGPRQGKYRHLSFDKDTATKLRSDYERLLLTDYEKDKGRLHRFIDSGNISEAKKQLPIAYAIEIIEAALSENPNADLTAVSQEVVYYYVLSQRLYELHHVWSEKKNFLKAIQDIKSRASFGFFHTIIMLEFCTSLWQNALPTYINPTGDSRTPDLKCRIGLDTIYHFEVKTFREFLANEEDKKPTQEEIVSRVKRQIKRCQIKGDICGSLVLALGSPFVSISDDTKKSIEAYISEDTRIRDVLDSIIIYKHIDHILNQVHGAIFFPRILKITNPNYKGTRFPASPDGVYQLPYELRQQFGFQNMLRSRLDLLDSNN